MVVESLLNVGNFFTEERISHADLPAVRAEVWSSPSAMRDFQAKAEELAEAVSAMPDPAKKREESFRLGCAFWILARHDEAIAAFDEVRTRKGALWLIGRCHAAAGRPALALDALERVVRGGDSDLEILVDLAAATRGSGDPEGARKLLERHAKAGETSADYHYEMAKCLDAQGDPVQAVELYERALELDPDCAKAAFRLGYIHDLYGDDDRALEYYEQCAAIAPEHVNALMNLGLFYEDLGKGDKAATCFAKVLRSIPNHQRAHLFYKDVKSYETEYFDEGMEQKVGKRQAVLDTPVTDFELSVRSRNCLQKMSINLLGDLTRITEEELLSYKNFGETSLNEIKAVLAQNALRLGHAIEEGEIDIDAGLDGESDELNRPVSDLDLSSRCRRCMDRLNVVTLADLTKLSKRELLDCPNLGKTTLEEIIEKLTELDLTLRDAEPESESEPAGDDEK